MSVSTYRQDAEALEAISRQANALQELVVAWRVVLKPLTDCETVTEPLNEVRAALCSLEHGLYQQAQEFTKAAQRMDDDDERNR